VKGQEATWCKLFGDGRGGAVIEKEHQYRAESYDSGVAGGLVGGRLTEGFNGVREVVVGAVGGAGSQRGKGSLDDINVRVECGGLARAATLRLVGGRTNAGGVQLLA
jgi:hypothetical protein